MTRYRYVTPTRQGKWYETLSEAQARASEIGAGFLAPCGTFTPYRGTLLEFSEHQKPDATGRS
jgi:hypothetical protein